LAWSWPALPAAAGRGREVWPRSIGAAQVAKDKAHKQAIEIRLRTFTVFPRQQQI
jgi:hypothetical protein